MKDILLGEDGDVNIVNADFDVGESDDQHLSLILQSCKNDWKQFPVLGVDLVTCLNDDSPTDMIRAIYENCATDGMTVNSVTSNDGKLNIDAKYKS